MTTAKPPARYRAMEGALAGGIATAELHHHRGRDPNWRRISAIEGEYRRRLLRLL